MVDYLLRTAGDKVSLVLNGILLRHPDEKLDMGLCD